MKRSSNTVRPGGISRFTFMTKPDRYPNRNWDKLPYQITQVAPVLREQLDDTEANNI
ncbi:MAG: hypothetical protein P0116_14280 [Candidatus Nitrosocosmicus sp.]|nr:hypothetical protein [Candidatus Nitrosocosmicus sp.]